MWAPAPAWTASAPTPRTCLSAPATTRARTLETSTGLALTPDPSDLLRTGSGPDLAPPGTCSATRTPSLEARPRTVTPPESQLAAAPPPPPPPPSSRSSTAHPSTPSAPPAGPAGLSPGPPSPDHLSPGLLSPGHLSSAPGKRRWRHPPPQTATGCNRSG